MMAEVVIPGKRWAQEEKDRDKGYNPFQNAISLQSFPSFCDISQTLNYENFLTRLEFEQYVERLSNQLFYLSEENEYLKSKISYLDSVVMKYFIEDIKKTSHENNVTLRQTLELPPLTKKADKSVIFELSGILEDMGNENISSVDVLREVRGE